MNNNNDNDTDGFRICGKKLVAVVVLPSAVIGLLCVISVGLGFTSAVYAGLVTIIGSLAGGIILGLFVHRWYEYIVQGVQAAMAGRLFITVAGLLIFVFWLNIKETRFFFFTAGFYIVGLFIETGIIIKLIRKDLFEQKDKSKTCSFADK